MRSISFRYVRNLRLQFVIQPDTISSNGYTCFNSRVPEEGVEKVGNRVLRPYQIEAFEQWAEKSFRGIVVAPTGTGKTVVGLYAIKKTG